MENRRPEDSQEVALRKESVDRNQQLHPCISALCVALRKESVDRNGLRAQKPMSACVALRKESVDRNP